jgi:crossover junction endodeoxyribonuclease RusA
VNRRPERLADLLPGMVAELARRAEAAAAPEIGPHSLAQPPTRVSAGGKPQAGLASRTAPHSASSDRTDNPMPTLALFVPGRPAPQGSKRHVGNGILVESSKALAPWRTTVAWHAAQAATQLLDGPIAVEVQFVMPRPTSLPKRKPTPPHVKRPDVDKLIRAILDALSGVIWHDDSQVVDLHPTKRYAELNEQPGAHIHVRSLAAVTESGAA